MPLRRTAAALAVATGLLAAAPAAQAGCGGVRASAAQKDLGNFRAPMIIGDSVLLGAVEQVARQGYEVNARGCRSWAEGARLVRQRARAGTLPHLVVMFLGADWMVTKAQIRETFFRIGHDRVLVLMTPRELGGRGGEDAQNMREVVREYPTRGFLLDWVRHTRDRSSWFASDGLHLGLPGIGGLARFSRRALRFAPPGKFPGPPPPDRAPSPTA